jgi:hypothetical protein
MGEVRWIVRREILPRLSVGKSSLGRSSRRLEDGIKVDI